MKIIRGNNKVVVIPDMQEDDSTTPQKRTLLGIHAAPTKLHYSPDTGKVHCTLRRAIHATTSLLTFSLDQNDEVCMYAKRGPWFSKVKFSILVSDICVGFLSLVHSNFSCLVYELSMKTTHDGGDSGKPTKPVPVAYILYQVPSITSYVANATPRRAQVALLTTNQSQHATYFRDVCTASIQMTGRLPSTAIGNSDTTVASSMRVEITASGVSMNVFGSKEPNLKPNGRWGLDLAGRGCGSSPKNMQLANDGYEDGAVFLQMAKWEDTTSKTYHVDFSAPFTPFQAFGFALAQMDL
jgi:hypothetical protein